MPKRPANPSKPEFYRRLWALCSQNGLSPAGLAEKIGLSNATASSWGRGVIPNGYTLIKIARELKTTADYILTGETTQIDGTETEKTTAINAINKLMENNTKLVENNTKLVNIIENISKQLHVETTNKKNIKKS